MARTEHGAALTEQHRRAQTQLRSRALRDYTALWPIWRTEDETTFATLVRAVQPLVVAYHRLSASLAASYYTAFRAAEDVPGEATPRIATPPGAAQINASMYVTGKLTWEKATRAGQDPGQARRTALVRGSGAVTRHVLHGGRDTLLQSTGADSQALGWARVTDNDPCAFCALLAGRGPVYKTAGTADFEAHDHCACIVEPFYSGSGWPGRAREYRALYNRAVREAAAAGDLDRGTANDQLNAFRRAYYLQRAGKDGS